MKNSPNQSPMVRPDSGVFVSYKNVQTYVFRHGETDLNAKGIAVGRLDVPLNENGRRQAALLGEQLSDIEFTHMYSTPLWRGRQTLYIALKPFAISDVKVTIDDGFIMRDIGILSGKNSKTECQEIFKQMENPDFVPTGGESENDAENRAWHAFMNIMNAVQNHPNPKIAISTHGGIARFLLKKAIPTLKMPFWGFNNTGVYRLDFNGRDVTLPDIRLNSWLKQYSR